MEHRKGVRANFKVSGSERITRPRAHISGLFKKKGERISASCTAPLGFFSEEYVVHIFPFSMTSAEFLRGLVILRTGAAESRVPRAVPGSTFHRQGGEGPGGWQGKICLEAFRV